MMNLTVDYPRMQEINLSYNHLTGSIPDSIFGSENVGPFDPTDNLQVFDLRYNQISGDFPERVLRAATLVSLLLGGNNMTGTISSNMTEFLTSIKYCDLSANDWSCPLPTGVDTACQAVCK